MAHSTAEDHHVKFHEEHDTFEKHLNRINVEQLGPWKMRAHLGFLKLHHTYDVLIPVNLPSDTNNWTSEAPSTYCSFKGYEVVEGQGGQLLVEFRAGKAKLLSDVLKLCSASNPELKMELALLARVLGKGQGTPMLKDGIHCTGIETDEEESEASDWQGFE